MEQAPVSGATSLEESIRSMDKRASEQAAVARRVKRVNAWLTLAAFAVVLAMMYHLYSVVAWNFSTKRVSTAVDIHQKQFTYLVKAIGGRLFTSVRPTFEETLQSVRAELETKIGEWVSEEMEIFDRNVRGRIHYSLDREIKQVWANHQGRIVGLFPDMKDEQSFGKIQAALSTRVKTDVRQIARAILDRFSARLAPVKKSLADLVLPYEQEQKKLGLYGTDLYRHYIHLWLVFADYELMHDEHHGAYVDMVTRLFGEGGKEDVDTLGGILNRLLRLEAASIISAPPPTEEGRKVPPRRNPKAPKKQ